jgi:Arc/MetJ-type ribon-helix-helix transcriptional regulator
VESAAGQVPLAGESVPELLARIGRQAALIGEYRDREAAQDAVIADGRPSSVERLLYNRFMSVGFRPTEDDLRVIEANRRQDEKTSDVIRRALRLLDREAWEERARADMHRLKGEDLSAEADAWEYDPDGNIRVVGTNLTVQAKAADHP